MPYIKQSFIDRIREQAHIADVIGLYSTLKKKGRHLFCLSPFSEEKTPSFCVYEDSERFVDYSSGRSGDVITFLMEKENLTYPDAIEWLARHLGYNVEYENAEWAKEKERRALRKESLRPYMVAAVRHYTEALRQLPADHPAKRELIEYRGYTPELLAEWELGFAPGGRFIWDKLEAKGVLNEGREIFLVGEKADKYWQRVIYPIQDENGLVVGMAGRDISGESKAAKWINPSENELYKKEKTWYALHRAKEQLRKRNEAWIVEGYNDVIAWHRYGLENTVASCGTAITDRQVTILKRFCGKVVFCMDGDSAGMKSMIRYIPLFLKAGFMVEAVLLDEQDPDEFARAYGGYMTHWGDLHGFMQEKGVRENGFKLLIDHYITGGELERAGGAMKMVEIAATVRDESFQEIYLGWITRDSGLSRTKINSWFKKYQAEAAEERATIERYLLPKSVKGNIKDFLDDIEKYGMFLANHQIWMLTGDGKPYTFMSVSNFTIEIIQHMQDEKLPMKLVRIRNIHGEERIFDTPSENLNTPMAFDNSMTSHGNFLWTGGRNEFQRLRSYLFDRMGVGHKIEVLGWQLEKFWVWNNAVTVPGEGTRQIDENGVYKNGSASYYVPSANHIYKHNNFKYTPQKKIVLIDSPVGFGSYVTKMIEVHRKHAITGILFTIATMFLDVIEDKLSNFPLLFLYGPASSGKDQLIECCQGFFGRPQSPLSLGNKKSTAKAHIRKFAQFRNMIVHLSEYHPGDTEQDETLKGLWGRVGYERGTIDSAYGTETVPIHSSVIFTANHYPDDDALITRFICEEMTKTEFSSKEKDNYRQLQDMNKKGFSSFTAGMLTQRDIFESKFKETYRKVENTLKADLATLGTHDRMIGNAAVLGAAYELMKDHVHFPFSWNEFIAHARSNLEKQVMKLNTASVYSKWWDSFLASITTKMNPLRHGREFKIVDDIIYFNFTATYNRVVQQWWTQYHEFAPSKSKVSDMIKKDPSFVEEKKSIRMTGGRNGANTSAWLIDMNTMRMDIKDDMHEAIEWQQREGTAVDDGTPAGSYLPTPKLPDSGQIPF